MAKSKSGASEHSGAIVGAIASLVLIPLLGYVAIGTKDHEAAISRLDERLGELRTDNAELRASLDAVKETVFRLGMKSNPAEAEILSGLVTDQPTAKGMSLYKQGNVQGAIEVWSNAAKGGSRDAIVALKAAGVAPSTLDRIKVTGARVRQEPRWFQFDPTDSDEKK